MKLKGNSGYFLFQTTLLLAVSSLLISLIFAVTSMVVDLQSLSIKAWRKRAILNDELFKKFTSINYPFSNETISCEMVQSDLVNYNIKKNLCHFTANNLPPKLSWFDFNKTFRVTSPCNVAPRTPGEFSLYQFRLSLASARELDSCTTIPASISDFRLRANIELNSQVTISNQIPDSPSMLATTGFIDLANTLFLEGDAIILAAGDIHLQEVVTNTSYRLSIISTTGSVVVNEISGPVELVAMGWAGTFIPTQTVSQSNYLLPQTKKIYVMGIY